MDLDWRISHSRIRIELDRAEGQDGFVSCYQTSRSRYMERLQPVSCRG